MEALHRVDKFHKTAAGYLVFRLVGFGLAYCFALWAVDSGTVWPYVVAVVFFVSVVQGLASRLLGRAVAYVKAR